MAGVILAGETDLRGIAMPDIDNEISAYEQMRDDLESRYMGKWIVIHDGNLVGTYDSFEVAASDAVTKFGRGPYLIRQVGAPPITLPASVMYNFING